MKLKSWYVALLGMVIQFVLGAFLLSGGWGAFPLAIVGYVILLASTLGVIPLILLIFERTRKIGAVVSIIFGIAGIILRAGSFG